MEKKRGRGAEVSHRISALEPETVPSERNIVGQGRAQGLEIDSAGEMGQPGAGDLQFLCEGSRFADG